MHILIGLLTAIAGLVWALYRLQNSGVDLNAFNPFYWARRRQWQKKLGTKPIHCLDNAMDAAALLLVAMAKLDGDITRESKTEIIALFESRFGLSNQEAVECFASSAYLLRDEINLIGEIKNILAPCSATMSSSQKQSLIDMLDVVGNYDGVLSVDQSAFKAEVAKVLSPGQAAAQQWT